MPCLNDYLTSLSLKKLTMDENTSIKLDKEFKTNLKFIRPYIIKLTNPKYITSCRVWLEKMSSCQPEEKAVRNDYLSELCRQIQNGEIEEPFISTPPEGPLIELAPVPCSSNSWSDISTISTNTEVPGSGDSTNELLQEKTSFPSIYENKIKEQQIIIEDLKNNNELLKERLRQCELSMNTRNSKAEVGINMMATEVDYLKERLKELIIMKRNLQASHSAIIMQWEESTRNLEVELQAEKEKNKFLELKINEVRCSFEQFKMNNCGDASKHIEYKLLDAHHSEICNIQEKHSEVIKYIEEKHSQLVQNKELEYDQAISDLKISYEQKIEEITAESEKNCKFRDEEITRLEKLVEVHCDSLQREALSIRSNIEQDCAYTNDALMEKVTFLQNCILKMERLLRRYERHYSKKISTLTKELQMQENTIQIQLTTQRAQLLAKASSERQMEIEDIVSQLEDRYRLLLEDQQAQVLDVRQEYSNIMTKLSEKFEVKATASA